jgi:hypothetical protein
VSTFWRTIDGVFVGISLLNLENINGAPIEFEVSPSCFDGGILNWNGGRLQRAKDLLGYSRVSYPLEELEKLKRKSTVSSKDVSDSLKKRMFLRNIDFYFPHSDS